MTRRWSPGQLGGHLGAASDIVRVQRAERLAIIGSATVAIAALVVAAGSAAGWLLLVLAALGVTSALRPDTVIPMVFIGVVACAWIATVDRGLTVWALPAALGLGGVHIAASVASLLPPEGSLPRALVVTWARRSAIVGVTTALVWVAAAGMDSLDSAADALLSGLALLLLAAGTWVLILRSRYEAPSGDEPDDLGGRGLRP